MPEFDSLSELILYVQEMDEMVAFYRAVFGLEIIEGDPEHGFVKFDTGGCRLCLHTGGEGDRGRDAPKFVFPVDDIQAARSHLQSHDVEVGAVRSPVPGVELFDERDPEGNEFSVESN